MQSDAIRRADCVSCRLLVQVAAKRVSESVAFASRLEAQGLRALAVS